MKKKVNIAICINLVDKLYINVKKSLKYLENNNIDFLKNNQYYPHITLCVGEINELDLDLVISKLKNLLSTHKPFLIKTDGLGIFIKEDINLHIRWVKNKKLIEKTLKSVWVESLEYNKESNWVAKSSLAYKDINYVNLSQIDFSKIDFLENKMYVNEISIIKFKLNRKEKC